MTKKPEPSKPMTRSIYMIAAKAVRLGAVAAPDAATAEFTAEFKVPATKLRAIRR
jgi:hypothetical protein